MRGTQSHEALIHFVMNWLRYVSFCCMCRLFNALSTRVEINMRTVSSREREDREYGVVPVFYNESDGYDMSDVVPWDTYPYDEYVVSYPKAQSTLDARWECKWNLLLPMEVFTLDTSKIKGISCKFAFSKRPLASNVQSPVPLCKFNQEMRIFAHESCFLEETLRFWCLVEKALLRTTWGRNRSQKWKEDQVSSFVSEPPHQRFVPFRSSWYVKLMDGSEVKRRFKNEAISRNGAVYTVLVYEDKNGEVCITLPSAYSISLCSFPWFLTLLISANLHLNSPKFLLGSYFSAAPPTRNNFYSIAKLKSISPFVESLLFDRERSQLFDRTHFLLSFKWPFWDCSRTIFLFWMQILMKQITDITKSEIHILWQAPQYFIVSFGEVLFSITGLSFAYSQVRADFLLCVPKGLMFNLCKKPTCILDTQWGYNLDKLPLLGIQPPSHPKHLSENVFFARSAVLDFVAGGGGWFALLQPWKIKRWLWARVEIMNPAQENLSLCLFLRPTVAAQYEVGATGRVADDGRDRKPHRSHHHRSWHSPRTGNTQIHTDTHKGAHTRTHIHRGAHTHAHTHIRTPIMTLICLPCQNYCAGFPNILS